MRIYFTALAMLMLFMNTKSVDENNDQLQNDNDARNKQVIVYTTAQGTGYRMTVTDTLHFKHMGQPFETQVCVLVDQSKRLQKIMGFGGPNTHALAESFYELPSAAQKELLLAYYDTTKGISYTMARTNTVVQLCPC